MGEEGGNKSEAAPTYPTRGNAGFCLKIEKKPTKKEEKLKEMWFVGLFSGAQPGPALPAKPRDGELAGKSGWKSIPAASRQMARREAPKTFLPLRWKYHFSNLNGLGLEAAAARSILPGLEKKIVIINPRRTAGYKKNNPPEEHPPTAPG